MSEKSIERSSSPRSRCVASKRTNSPARARSSPARSSPAQALGVRPPRAVPDRFAEHRELRDSCEGEARAVAGYQGAVEVEHADELVSAVEDSAELALARLSGGLRHARLLDLRSQRLVRARQIARALLHAALEIVLRAEQPLFVLLPERHVAEHDHAPGALTGFDDVGALELERALAIRRGDLLPLSIADRDQARELGPMPERRAGVRTFRVAVREQGGSTCGVRGGDAVPPVQHEHRVGQILDHELTRGRHEIEEPVAA